MNLKFGKITEMDAAAGMAKVTFTEDDNLVTRWLPISFPKTLKDKFSIPFDINEHVWCIMDPYCENGIIGGAIYDSNNKAGGSDGVTSIQFGTTLGVEFDRSASTLNVSGIGNINIDVNGTVNIQSSGIVHVKGTIINLDAPLVTANNLTVSGIMLAGQIGVAPGSGGGNGSATFMGDITSTGTITAGVIKEGNIQLSKHKHPGVQPGGGITGEPL